jgi:hypothetical protein
MLLKVMPQYWHLDDDADVEVYRKFMLPITPQDADVVAGIYLKLSLRELLFAVHRERPLDGFPEYRWGRRTELYQALDKVTFEEYAYKILSPCYPGRTTEELLADSSLRSIEKTLRNSQKIRVFHNIDDFLVNDEERAWFDEVLKGRIVWFSNGGHLGNFYYKSVLRQIVDAAGVAPLAAIYAKKVENSTTAP